MFLSHQIVIRYVYYICSFIGLNNKVSIAISLPLIFLVAWLCDKYFLNTVSLWLKKKKKVNVYDCSVIELPKIETVGGNITPVHPQINVPFDIKRVFYSYDIPGGEARGAHAHKECHQFLIAASGAYEVLLDDGVNKRTVLLNRPFFGLHVPPGIWASEQAFSSGSICLVLASHGYIEEDYIRNYEDYLEYIK